MIEIDILPAIRALVLGDAYFSTEQLAGGRCELTALIFRFSTSRFRNSILAKLNREFALCRG